MNTARTSFLVALIMFTCLCGVVAQNCLIVEQRTTRDNADDERLVAAKTMVVKYHYDRFGRLDTMVKETGQVYTWRYIADTVVQQTGNRTSRTNNTYVMNRQGNVELQEAITDVFANDTTEARIASNMAVYNYFYNGEGKLAEMLSYGNEDNLNTKTVYKWENGNKIAEEVVDAKGKVSERLVYEYYEDKPYQNLYPTAVNLHDTPRNLIKTSSVQVNGVPLMTLTFFYEYNANGLISKLTTVSSTDNHKSVTEFIYDCR